MLEFNQLPDFWKSFSLPIRALPSDQRVRQRDFSVPALGLLLKAVEVSLRNGRLGRRTFIGRTSESDDVVHLDIIFI